MKLYDLSYSYFFSLLTRGFWGQMHLCRCRFKWGPHVAGPGCYNNHFDFSLFFSLVCRLSYPYRLSNKLFDYIIERYKFRIRSNLFGRGFSLSPLYHIVRAAAAVLPAWPCFWRSRSGRRRSRQSKVGTAVSGLVFLCLDFCHGRRTDAKPPQILALPRCATRSAVSLQWAISWVILVCLARCQGTSSAQLAFSFCGLLGFVQVVPSQHGQRLAQPRLAALAQSLAFTRYKASCLNPCIMSLRPIRPSVKTVFRRLLRANTIIILLIRDFPQYLRITACFYLWYRATIPLSSAFGYRQLSALASLELSQPSLRWSGARNESDCA